ncbi:hypothetical protein Lsai_0234 [Legionella sainthelensi]|uniref:Uncharacterized protein n=1 Tax=Legionella sainthelensi TaxID=28087 RepID=A0A0W0YTB2_9GAMM|nr:hypothetical protein [Legionella sainthelensi]KTD60124.1 hypothetical protein Lsai_0234 [Legionella sainthelensi]VEH32683.1 Uncharacterised protein [Legionella sainthelensi]
MKLFQKIFTNKSEKKISTVLKNNIEKQGRFFSTKTESHLKGIGIDNHELNHHTPVATMEKQHEHPAYVNGVGIDNYEPRRKTLFIANKNEALSTCVNGIGVDNYEPKLHPSFFLKKEKIEIPTCVNGVGIDNYEPIFSK